MDDTAGNRANKQASRIMYTVLRRRGSTESYIAYQDRFILALFHSSMLATREAGNQRSSSYEITTMDVGLRFDSLEYSISLDFSRVKFQSSADNSFCSKEDELSPLTEFYKFQGNVFTSAKNFFPQLNLSWRARGLKSLIGYSEQLENN